MKIWVGKLQYDVSTHLRLREENCGGEVAESVRVYFWYWRINRCCGGVIPVAPWSSSSHPVILNFEVSLHANVTSPSQNLQKYHTYSALIGLTLCDVKAKSIINNIIDRVLLQRVRMGNAPFGPWKWLHASWSYLLFFEPDQSTLKYENIEPCIARLHIKRFWMAASCAVL